MNRVRSFYEGKLLACRYFFRYVLPTVEIAFDLVRSLDDTCLAIEREQFQAGRDR